MASLLVQKKKDVSNIFKQYTVGDMLELIVIRGGDSDQVTIPVKLAEKVWCGRNKSKAVELIKQCYEDRSKAINFRMSPQKYLVNSDVQFESFEVSVCYTNKEGSAKIDEHAKELADNEQAKSFCASLCQCLRW